jgi:cell division protein FtsB
MPPATNKPATPFRRLLRSVAWVGGIGAALFFAMQGGEYSTLDVIDRRARRDKLQAEVTRKRVELDSLKAEYHAVTTDPARLERVAREQYGMIRGEKELLYRIGGPARAEVDSAVANDSARSAHAAGSMSVKSAAQPLRARR